MSTEPLRTTADELRMTVLQLDANPPDGDIELTTKEGRLVASWTSAGDRTVVGPVVDGDAGRFDPPAV